MPSRRRVAPTPSIRRALTLTALATLAACSSSSPPSPQRLVVDDAALADETQGETGSATGARTASSASAR
jgi:hypothetical protein